MKNKFQFLSMILVVIISLTGCSNPGYEDVESNVEVGYFGYPYYSLLESDKLKYTLEFDAYLEKNQLDYSLGQYDCDSELLFSDIDMIREFLKLANCVNGDVEYEAIDRLYTTYRVDDKWKEIVVKDGNDITFEEYMVLSMIFINLDKEEMEDFINLMFNEVGSYEDSLLDNVNERLFSVANPKWVTSFYECDYYEGDSEKIQGMREATTYLSSQYFVLNSILLAEMKESGTKSNEEIGDLRLIYSSYREKLMQRFAIFTALDELPIVSSADDNIVNIQTGELDALVLMYNDIGVAGSLGNIYSNMIERKIIISRVEQGLSHNMSITYDYSDAININERQRVYAGFISPVGHETYYVDAFELSIFGINFTDKGIVDYYYVEPSYLTLDRIKLINSRLETELIRYEEGEIETSDNLGEILEDMDFTIEDILYDGQDSMDLFDKLYESDGGTIVMNHISDGL